MTTKTLMIGIRYGLPALMFAGAMAMLVIEPNSTGIEGFAMGTGAALSLLLINALWRLGFEGDKERDAEEEARRYLMQHGHWPPDDDD
ncbi:MAG: hypothetical protein QOF76_898 [Solirubrobacteraceae bacterium]|nr:hypothetical protein [Solirubrobacteraceae bacterium]